MSERTKITEMLRSTTKQCTCNEPVNPGIVHSWQTGCRFSPDYEIMADAVLSLLADARRQVVEECVSAITSEIAPFKAGKEGDIVDITWNRACRNLADKIRAIPPAGGQAGACDA